MEGRVPLLEDMLIEILVHLPVKSLMRFRCISKHWCVLIKGSIFITRHLKSQPKKTLLLKRYLPPHNIKEFQPGGDDVLSVHDLDRPELLVSPSLLVPFFDDVYSRYQVNLFGPSNGLVCLVFQDVIVLSNPALREFKLLDPAPFALPEYYGANNCGSGFGFDVNTNDYKVIQMWYTIELSEEYNEDIYIRIDLYNLSTNSWRPIDELVPHVRYDPGFDIFFNGACHWNANEHIEGPLTMGVILSFDISTEVFRKFEFPDNWLNDGKSPGLVVLKQCLALVRYNAGWDNELHLIDIWIMKEYGMKESWTKELVIGPYLFKCPLLCWKNEWLLAETIDSQLAYYSLHENEIKRFQYYAFEGSPRAILFRESLISLNQVCLYCK